MRQTLLLLACSLLLLPGCDRSASPNGQANGTAPATSPEAQRDAWQKPEQVLALMDGFVRGKRVAHLYAADGYFTFKLVEAGARVIAIDPDPANIAALEARKEGLGLTDDQLTIRAMAPGDPGLSHQEADAALIVHAYKDIPDRRNFFQRLLPGLKGERPVFLVEWQHRETPVGPPLEERLPAERIMEELGSYGFAGVGAQNDKVPYQVVFLALDPLEDDMYP
jgi:hypothetical protein